jgi:hypothetical protein
MQGYFLTQNADFDNSHISCFAIHDCKFEQVGLLEFFFNVSHQDCMEGGGHADDLAESTDVLEIGETLNKEIANFLAQHLLMMTTTSLLPKTYQPNLALKLKVCSSPWKVSS